MAKLKHWEIEKEKPKEIRREIRKVKMRGKQMRSEIEKDWRKDLH